MAKSYTKRKSRTRSKKRADPKQVEQINQKIDHAVARVQDWKRKEFARLVENPQGPIPVCYTLTKERMIVGSHGIKKDGAFWHVFDARHGKEFIFSHRSNAVAFSFCSQKGQMSLASDILKFDTKLIKLQDDLSKFQRMMKFAVSKKDYWKYDFYDSMCLNTRYRLEDTKNQLTKSLNLAKYFKNSGITHYESKRYKS